MRRGPPKMLALWDVELPAPAKGDPQQRMIALQPSELTSSFNARPNLFLKENQHTIYSWQPTTLQLWKRLMGRRGIPRMSKQLHPQRKRYRKSWRNCSTLHVIYSKFTSPRMILALICQRWSKRRRRESSRRLMGPCPIWLHTWRSCNFQSQLWTLFCLPRLRFGELHRWGDIFCWVHGTTNYALCWIKLNTFVAPHYCQVYFQNNPLSGLLILIGMFVQSTRVAVHGIIAVVAGNLWVIICFPSLSRFY